MIGPVAGGTVFLEMMDLCTGKYRFQLNVGVRARLGPRRQLSWRWAGVKMTVYKFDRLCFVRRSSGSLCAATIVALRVVLRALPIFLTRLGSNNSTTLRSASV